MRRSSVTVLPRSLAAVVALVVAVALALTVFPSSPVAAASTFNMQPVDREDRAVRNDLRVSVSGDVPDGVTIESRKSTTRFIAVLADGTEYADPCRYGVVPAAYRNKFGVDLGVPGIENDFLRVDETGMMTGQLTLSALFSGPNPDNSCQPTQHVRQAILQVELSNGTVLRSAQALRVDYTRPTIDAAQTVGSDRVRVRFSEPVQMKFEEQDLPTDWTVEYAGREISVLAIEEPPASTVDCVYDAGEDTTAGQFGCTRVLRLAEKVSEDASPTVTYTIAIGDAGQFPDRQGYWDYASNRTLGAIYKPKSALDLVRPFMPTIQQIGGRAPGADGAVVGFDATPSVQIGNLTAGHTVLLQVTGDNGTVEHRTTADGQGVAQFAELPVGPDGVYNLKAVAIDANGNRSDELDKNTPSDGRSDGDPTASYLLDTLAPSIAPDISGVEVGLPSGQTAAKDADTISVTGCITQAAHDLDPNTLQVVLKPNAGAEIAVKATATASSGSCDYRINGSASKVDWEDGTTSFLAQAQVSDTFGNTGGNVSARHAVDLLPPKLAETGRTLSSNTIRVQFLDSMLPDVKGGCDPNAWRIDGVPGSVTKVTYAGEDASCYDPRNTDKPVPAGSAGVRIIHTRVAMDRDAAPRVTYSTTTNNDPARDGALNKAVEQTIDTVSGIIPPAPSITAVTRNAGRETAYAETNARGGDLTYFTRFPGTGNPNTEDLQVTFAGGRSGYIAQVLDQGGRVLASQQLTSTGLISLSREVTSSIRIPIGTTDNKYVRGLRLVSGSNLGEVTWFSVVLDRVRPTLQSAVKTDNTTVVVTFSEFLPTGTDYADDWMAFENLADGGQQWYSAEEAPTVTENRVRNITFKFQNLGSFGGVHYRVASENAIRYEDRAGNQMADTLQ